MSKSKTPSLLAKKIPYENPRAVKGAYWLDYGPGIMLALSGRGDQLNMPSTLALAIKQGYPALGTELTMKVGYDNNFGRCPFRKGEKVVVCGYSQAFFAQHPDELMMHIRHVEPDIDLTVTVKGRKKGGKVALVPRKDLTPERDVYTIPAEFPAVVEVHNLGPSYRGTIEGHIKKGAYHNTSVHNDRIHKLFVEKLAVTPPAPATAKCPYCRRLVPYVDVSSGGSCRRAACQLAHMRAHI